jgi:hypothetical protein
LNRLAYPAAQHHDVMSGWMSNASRLCPGYLWGDRDFPGRHKFHSAPAVDAACFAQDHNQLPMSQTLDPAVVAVLDLLILAYDHAYRYFEYNGMSIGILKHPFVNKSFSPSSNERLP